jgi:hypothetical protein
MSRKAWAGGGPEEAESIERAYRSPSPLQTPVESILAWETVRRAVVVAPAVVGGALLLRGGAGAVSAAVGVTVVVANFLLAGAVLSKAATVSLRVYHAAALLGFLVRLGLITLTMLLLAAVFEVDRPAMGIAAVVAYLTLLTWEAWAVVRGAERELEWN